MGTSETFLRPAQPVNSYCDLIFRGQVVQISLPPEGMFVASARVGMHPHATSKIDAKSLIKYLLFLF